ncbi:MAG TPA: hypothetical protein VF752_03485, partial [Thermoleophilaceae bacterium]
MGRRSRKRASAGTGPEAVSTTGSTRAERDAARSRRAQALERGEAPGRPHRVSARPRTRPKPPAPWGSFPLSELVILLGIVFVIAGLVVWGDRGRTLLVAGMVLGSLGGLEVSIREHFAGYKSHTTLLAASTAVLSMILVSAIGGASGLAVLGIVVAVGVLVFVLAFWGFRQAFMRRSGGLGF